MYNRHIRHLVTELGNRLSDKEFLKKIGLSRRSMQQLFNKDHWESIPGDKTLFLRRNPGILPRRYGKARK